MQILSVRNEKTFFCYRNKIVSFADFALFLFQEKAYLFLLKNLKVTHKPKWNFFHYNFPSFAQLFV